MGGALCGVLAPRGRQPLRGVAGRGARALADFGGGGSDMAGLGGHTC